MANGRFWKKENIGTRPQLQITGRMAPGDLLMRSRQSQKGGHYFGDQA